MSVHICIIKSTHCWFNINFFALLVSWLLENVFIFSTGKANMCPFLGQAEFQCQNTFLYELFLNYYLIL